jgi:hypothetical protein
MDKILEPDDLTPRTYEIKQESAIPRSISQKRLGSDEGNAGSFRRIRSFEVEGSSVFRF